MSLFGDATNFITGGANKNATDAQQRALEALAQVQTPTVEQLSLPELEKYAAAVGMTPAQMQSFLQESNAFQNQNIPQEGTQAQIAALNQLANVANAGAEGSPTQQAQVEQINQDAARNLAGQRGAIDQQAAARGVPVGLLQAALQSQRAGEGQQNAHMAALQAQGQNYQQALQAMAQGGALGGQLQGQQNTQANQVAAAQNAMQQFNAANQQNASAANAANRQASNLYNTQAANQVNSANTGLANQRTQYNTQVPQTIFQNNLNKATGMANQNNQMANTYTNQGQQAAGLFSGLLGAGASLIGGPAAGAVMHSTGTGYQNGPPASANTDQYRPYAHGGITENNAGDCSMKSGGMVPGQAKHPGDSEANDTVQARLSPGEAVIPRTQVQQNPMDVMRLLAGRPASVPQRGEPMPGHHPADIAALLAAMKHLRGSH